MSLSILSDACPSLSRASSLHLAMRAVSPTSLHHSRALCHSTSPPSILRGNGRSTRRLSMRAGADAQSSEDRRRHLWKLTTLSLWIGVASIGYWAYTTWRESREIWPLTVAPELRRALFAKHKGDLEDSEQCFRRSLDLLLQIPPEDMRGDPHLKITGVAIALADLLESQGKNRLAYGIYSDAITYLQRVRATTPLSGPEALRFISISYRLGELAASMKLLDEEEKWLSTAVEEALKASKTTDPPSDDSSSASQSQVLGAIELPDWATTTDIAAPLEALAEFYERQGKIDFALPLYLHSTSILVPPKAAKQTSPEDKCRGANMMLKISNLIISGPLNKEVLHQADAWAQKGLAVVKDARVGSWRTVPACEEMLVAAYHGAGYMKELSGDYDGARQLYELAVKQAKALGLTEESETIAKHRDSLRVK